MSRKLHIDIALQRIRSFITENGGNIAAFARSATLRQCTIHDVFKDEFNPTLKTIRKMEQAIPGDWEPEDNK